jgi:hypothetical protein
MTNSANDNDGRGKMADYNIYAAPKAQVGDNNGSKCTRLGDLVVVPVGSDLPARCIMCNAPAKTPIKKSNLQWHTPWLYLLLLFNLLVYAIVAMIVRKTMKLSPGLCQEHATRRSKRVYGLLGGAVLAFAAGVTFMHFDVPPGGVLAFTASAILLVVASFASRKVYAKFIDTNVAHVAGCKEPFLRALR